MGMLELDGGCKLLLGFGLNLGAEGRGESKSQPYARGSHQLKNL